MPTEGNDDGEDEPKTYHEYKLAKDRTGRKAEWDGEQPDPAEGFDGVGEGGGFEDVLEGDGDVQKSAQETLEDALGDVDFIGADPVEKGDDDPVGLSWSDEDFEDPTEAELLAEIRDELARMNAADRERALKSLTTDARHGTTDGAREAADAVTAFDRLEQQIGALRDQEQAEMVEDVLTAYVEADSENGLEDPLADVAAWLREQAEDLEDPEERRRVTDALDRLPDTGRTLA